MKTLNVDNSQASQIAKQAKGDKMLFLEMMVQPPDDARVFEFHNEWYYTTLKSDDPRSYAFNFWEPTKLKYPTGTIIGIRESWAYDGEEYVYKENYPTAIEWGDIFPLISLTKQDTKIFWQSSATMPHEAIIRKYEVIGNEVKSVQDFVNDINLYLPFCNQRINEKKFSTPADWFNSLYAKPRPVRKNGVIVRYVCYCWDDNGVDWLADSKHYDYPPDTWKGKDLEIIVNPYWNLVEGIKK